MDIKSEAQLRNFVQKTLEKANKNKYINEKDATFLLISKRLGDKKQLSPMELNGLTTSYNTYKNNVALFVELKPVDREKFIPLDSLGNPQTPTPKKELKKGPLGMYMKQKK